MRRAYIGVTAQTMPLPRRLTARVEIANASGALITGIEPGSPAAISDLRLNDVVVALDGAMVGGVDDLGRMLNAERIARPIELAVLRQGAIVTARMGRGTREPLKGNPLRQGTEAPSALFFCFERGHECRLASHLSFGRGSSGACRLYSWPG